MYLDLLLWDSVLLRWIAASVNLNSEHSLTPPMSGQVYTRRPVLLVNSTLRGTLSDRRWQLRLLTHLPAAQVCDGLWRVH